MTWKKLLWSDDAVVVRKNSGADIGTRQRLNFLEGTNITLAISDDAVGDEIDIVITASGSGADYTIDGGNATSVYTGTAVIDCGAAS